MEVIWMSDAMLWSRIDTLHGSCQASTTNKIISLFIYLLHSHGVSGFKTQPHRSLVVELKVDLDCDGCIKKILKAIKKMEDIETYDLDTELNKVTITGNVTTEEVIKVFQKIRKPATNWEEDGAH
ncbi:hypothetical protein RHMOL_Rhmol09G0241100 [Rhododendron molle]|uniref:Uncharacterized protein n=1 Tax=Rhododendron molle TaxID=49168 RepID=A0ACC0MHU5_RHOML|nr:hypothetical protein RHMOL_Rhmol09G0241100 [Rhododendron molle]